MAISKNIAKIFCGKVAGQIVVFVAAPIITRLFIPEQFGVFQIFISIFSVLGVIACLHYQFTIPLGDTKQKAVESFILSIISTIIMTMFSLALVLLLKSKVAYWFEKPELENLLWFLPLFIFAKGLVMSLNYWGSRHKKFSIIAASAFSTTLSYRIIVIALAYLFGAASYMLFTGYLGSLVISLSVYMLFLSPNIFRNIKESHLSLSSLWQTAKYYKKFPLVNSWSGLLNMTSIQLMPIVLGLYFDTAVVGHYSLGYKLISMPTMVFGLSISQVFYPEAAQEFNETGSLKKIASKIFKVLVYIGVFPTLVLAFLGAPIFGFVFGDNWYQAGIYSQIMAPWYLLVFTVSPLSTISLIKQRQGMMLIFNIILILSRFAALIIGGQTGNILLTIALFVAVSVLAWIWYTYWLFGIAGVSLKWAAKKLFNHTALSSLLILPALGLSLTNQSIYAVLASLIIATGIYTFCLYRFDKDIRHLVNSVFIKRGTNN